MSGEYSTVAITAKEIEDAMGVAHAMIYQKIGEGGEPSQVRKHSLVFAMGVLIALAADENFDAVSWALNWVKRVVDAAEPQVHLANIVPEKKLLN